MRTCQGSAFQLIIFDCDGVLIDSERLAVQVDAAVITQLGWPITEEEVAERFVGRPEKYMISEIEKCLGRRLSDDFEDELGRMHHAAFQKELLPVNGILEALRRIDTPTCVASSGTHEKMKRTLGMTGLYQRFEGRIFSSSEVSHGKPAPDLFLHAAKCMATEPAACAVVEDSAFGVQAARAAGMHAFGYAGGLTSASRLNGSNTVVFNNMIDLPELLTKASSKTSA